MADQARQNCFIHYVEERAVIPLRDVDFIYQIPRELHEQGLDDIVIEILGLKAKDADLTNGIMC